jgi:hypothetical protein
LIFEFPACPTLSGFWVCGPPWPWDSGAAVELPGPLFERLAGGTGGGLAVMRFSLNVEFSINPTAGPTFLVSPGAMRRARYRTLLRTRLHCRASARGTRGAPARIRRTSSEASAPPDVAPSSTRRCDAQTHSQGQAMRFITEAVAVSATALISFRTFGRTRSSWRRRGRLSLVLLVVSQLGPWPALPTDTVLTNIVEIGI